MFGRGIGSESVYLGVFRGWKYLSEIRNILTSSSLVEAGKFVIWSNCDVVSCAALNGEMRSKSADSRLHPHPSLAL